MSISSGDRVTEWPRDRYFAQELQQVDDLYNDGRHVLRERLGPQQTAQLLIDRICGLREPLVHDGTDAACIQALARLQDLQLHYSYGWLTPLQDVERVIEAVSKKIKDGNTAGRDPQAVHADQSTAACCVANMLTRAAPSPDYGDVEVARLLLKCCSDILCPLESEYGATKAVAYLKRLLEPVQGTDLVHADLQAHIAHGLVEGGLRSVMFDFGIPQLGALLASRQEARRHAVAILGRIALAGAAYAALMDSAWQRTRDLLNDCFKGFDWHSLRTLLGASGTASELGQRVWPGAKMCFAKLGVPAPKFDPTWINNLTNAAFLPEFSEDATQLFCSLYLPALMKAILDPPASTDAAEFQDVTMSALIRALSPAVHPDPLVTGRARMLTWLCSGRAVMAMYELGAINVSHHAPCAPRARAHTHARARAPCMYCALL